MPLPNSVIKMNRKNGEVTFISNVDRVKYTLRELILAANYDVAKFLVKQMRVEAKKSPSMKHLPNRRFNNIFQYWVRRKENDLQIGIKANTWYGVQGELGTKNQPRRGILRNTVFKNIDMIRRIQGKYLSAINDENLAKGIISENEHREEKNDE